MKFRVLLLAILFSLFVTQKSAVAEMAYSDVLVLVGTTIDLEISSDDIIIEDIMPGMFVNGNDIGIKVWTNDDSGYTLYAAVGDEVFQSSNLEHEVSTSVFSALGTGSFSASQFGNNTWGISLDDGATYFGLPYYLDGEKVIDVKAVAGTTEINVRTAAKAGTDIDTGKYENLITFTAVPNI